MNRPVMIFNLLIVFFTLFGGLQAAEILPDTGQMKFYDYIEEINQPMPGEPFYGQDAQYARVRSYSKLDQNGSVLPDSATVWHQVKDNITGMIWEVKTNDNTVHNRNDKYTWNNAQGDFIAQLNSGGGYCGKHDWRLPTVKELSYLTDSGHNEPAINRDYFPQTISSDYWSSTDRVLNSSNAWVVGFFTGEVDNYNKESNRYYVRAVRTVQSQTLKPLVDNGNGTISDPNTNLMWQQAEAGEMCWEEALSYCENLTLVDYDDWRLPNRNELQSLINYNDNIPCLDKTLFPGAFSSYSPLDVSFYYWSSTTDLYARGVWVGSFWYGGLQIEEKASTYCSRDLSNCFTEPNSYYVRAVRFIQSETTDPLGFDNDGDGFTPNRGDCNDNDPSIHPGAVEICGDGIDQDCDGGDLVCSIDIPSPYNYYLPYYLSNATNWSGVGLKNCNASSSANVVVSAFNNLGTKIVSESMVIPGDGQKAAAIGSSNGEGWMKVSSSQPLTGLCFIGTAGQGNHMADISLSHTLSTFLHVPHVAQTANEWDTKILVCNPNNASTNVILTLVNPSGTVVNSSSFSISANGSGQFSIPEFSGGSVEITSTHGVAAFALYNNLKWGGNCYAGISAVDPAD